MLAQTFKSAKDLKLRQEVYDALVKVYWMLADEEIPERLFNMGSVGEPKLTTEGKPCGSAGCIQGWLQAILHEDLNTQVGIKGPKALNTLCYSGVVISAFSDQATRQQGARAIHNYLTTGRANWRGVLKA